MEKIIKSILFIKMFAFVLLTWISHFNNDKITFNKSMDDNYKLGTKLGANTFRLLAKYHQNKDYSILGLKQNMPNITEYEKTAITINKKGAKDRNKQSNKSLLNKAQYYTEVTDYNNGMFDGKHFHFQKKWLKKKDYDNFVEKNRRIHDISLKKIKFRKYRYAVAIFFLFFFLGIGLPLSCEFKFARDVTESPGSAIDKMVMKYISGVLGIKNEGHIFILLYAVTFIMLAVIIIIAVYKVLRNNEKYQKIKLMTE
ncbi:hypothetical protein MKS88_004011 [Plasmodium brasilianum]|uniref:Uncharacterized protein n=1 Tax=Plasmodium brasilianum TaxID=5824 RepID=A0ACB9Y3H2_PLABR|nr:hypothetical protein MKS88_004011 [Plasmodium brasilianum]